MDPLIDCNCAQLAVATSETEIAEKKLRIAECEYEIAAYELAIAERSGSPRSARIALRVRESDLERARTEMERAKRAFALVMETHIDLMKRATRAFT